MKPARWFLALFWLTAAPAQADDAELRERLVDLYVATVPRHCDFRDCPWGLYLEGAISDLARGNPARSLGRAATAIHQLGGHPRGSWGWALVAFMEAAFERAEEAREEAEQHSDRLCSGMRFVLAARFLQANRLLELARAAESRGLLPRTTMYLGLAVHVWGYSARVSTGLQARCVPRACPASTGLAFTPGPSGNPSLALLLPDRGTLLEYDFSSSALPGGELQGTLRRTYASLASYRTAGALTRGGQPASLSGATAVAACSDASGWIRVASLSDSLLLRSGSSAARLFSALRALPASTALPAALGMLPPLALEPRVGDRVEERGVALRGVQLPGGAADLRCDVAHRVEAIEPLSVAAGSFETARVVSDVVCSGTRAGAPLQEVVEITSWLASEVGHVRVQVRGGQALTSEWNLRCFEVPESAGRCGAL